MKENITWHLVLLQVQTRSGVVSTRVKKGSTLNLLKVTSVFHLSAEEELLGLGKHITSRGTKRNCPLEPWKGPQFFP